MVASTVSSKMIEAMATAEGFKFVECLTGYSFNVGRRSRLNLPALRFQIHWQHRVGSGRAGIRSSVWVRRSDWIHDRIRDSRQGWCRGRGIVLLCVLFRRRRLLFSGFLR
jgi:hypothetical protein